MNFGQGKNLLNEKNFLIAGTKLPYSWKKVRSMNFQYESFDKFITKAILLHIIVRNSTRKNPIGGLTEHEFPDGKRVDVLKIDGKTKKFTGYMIKTSKDKKRTPVNMIPIITIDLKKAPPKIHSAFKTLEDYFISLID